MAAPEKFRVAAFAVGITLLVYSCASAFSGTFSMASPRYPTDLTRIEATSPDSQPEGKSRFAPYRTDIAVTQSLSVALRALRSKDESPAAQMLEENLRAQIDVKYTLALAPQTSGLWLVLALLQTPRNPNDRQVIESLKMSYFTAPNDASLMPLRLNAVTLFEAASDGDLADLARGDLRLMLTRQPELRAAVAAAYRRGSRTGRTFLEHSIESLDPVLGSVIRGG